MNKNPRQTVLFACVPLCLAAVLLVKPVRAPQGSDAEMTQRRTPMSVIVDAYYTREQALAGSHAPQEILNRQVLVVVHYSGMDGKEHEGQIVCDSSVRNDVRSIFHTIDSLRFPLQSVIPIVHFGWDDDSSVKANNTSAFNYRMVEGSRHLSKHSYGIAIDINPWLNPWQRASGKRKRAYDLKTPGTLQAGGAIVRAFRAKGWTWGGNWKGSKDYQHFDKR